MSTEPQMPERFNPAEHFRSLKGQQYLETKWRLVWFRSEHPDGHVETELLEHDAANGLAVFKARVSYIPTDNPEGFGAVAMGHGSETRKDFADYLEKAETKAIGRALAVLGYGTQFAQELDEGLEKGGLSATVDSPVDARPRAQQTQPARRTETVHEPTGQQPVPDVTADKQKLIAYMRADAAGKDTFTAKNLRVSQLTERETADWNAWFEERQVTPDAHGMVP